MTRGIVRGHVTKVRQCKTHGAVKERQRDDTARIIGGMGTFQTALDKSIQKTFSLMLKT